jgi:hypothetical protein
MSDFPPDANNACDNDTVFGVALVGTRHTVPIHYRETQLMNADTLDKEV